MFWDPWNVLRVYHLAGYMSPVSLVSLGFLGESLAEICQEWKVTGRNRDYLKSWPRTSAGPRFQHCSTTTSHPKVSVMWKATCHFLIVQCYNRYLSSCAKQSEDHLSVKYRLWRAEPAELCSLAVSIVCSWPDMNITYLECCFFFFFFHTVAKRAGVRIADRPNTETSVFVLPESARSGAKFVYTKMWALSGTLCCSSSAAVKSGGKARNLMKRCKYVYQFIEDAMKNKFWRTRTHTHTLPTFTFCSLIPSEWNLTHQRQLIMKRPADSRS